MKSQMSKYLFFKHHEISLYLKVTKHLCFNQTVHMPLYRLYPLFLFTMYILTIYFQDSTSVIEQPKRSGAFFSRVDFLSGISLDSVG